MTSLLSQSPPWFFPFCPTAPDWSPDWDSIENHFDWIGNLKGCPQDPIYHAEGDVLTHTRMVCEALVSSQAWRQLPTVERSLLFAAALLHDVAKPDCTSVDEDGRVSSKGHVRQGARVARQILWQLDVPVPFQDRERVVALVQHGGLPIWFLEKPNPQRTVIRASQVIQCELLAQLAEADVRGRHCHDQQELLDRIELFREFCQENDCLHSPRQFLSAHSRFVYFRKEDGDPNYAAYDDTQFEVVLMSGLPGVGKDHWIAENLPDLPVISLDALRRQMNISPNDDQGVVANQAKAIAREYMRAGRSFVWNATNTTRSMRSLLIDFFAAYQARIRIVYLEVPFEELLRRNRSRMAMVPEAVIHKLAGKLEVPEPTEAHEVQWVVNT